MGCVLDTTISILTDNNTTTLEPSQAEREKQRQIEKMEIKMADYRLHILALRLDKPQAAKSLTTEELIKNSNSLIEDNKVLFKKVDSILQQAEEVLQPFQKAKKIFEKIQADNATLARFNRSLPATMR